MLIKEFRIPLPLCTEEYQIGQLYAVAEMSKNVTGGGEGVEVVKNEPFKDFPLLGGKYNSGQYTYKIYHLSSKVPAIIRLLAPKGSLEVHEEAWNAYPYSKTVITNPMWMKDKFTLIIESIHLDDTGDTENALELTPEQLLAREVIEIDIVNDPIPRSDYKELEDPAIFKSVKTGRGPYKGIDWKKNVKPLMTCYKVVHIDFQWFGLQSKIEPYVQKSERRLFTTFHRQLFCWIDRWYDLSLDEVRRYEEQIKDELDQQRANGEVRGMNPDD